MPNTITEYNVFSANTLIRSARVNTNFANYRGDIIPINTDTATASDNSHDLGVIDHQWRYIYGAELRLRGSGYIKFDTATSSIQFSNDSSTTYNIIPNSYDSTKYIGTPNTVNSWRVVNSTGTLVFEKYETGGSWVEYLRLP